MAVSCKKGKTTMALPLTMVGLAVQDMGKSLEFYRRLGLAIPDRKRRAVSYRNQPHICEDDGECARIRMEAMNSQLYTAITTQFIGVSKNFDCMDWLCKPIYSKRWVF
jgi:hypothetical protein